MRFCNNCGYPLPGPQAAPQAPAPAQQYAPPAPAPSPYAAPRPGSPYGAQPAPVCWRCRSLGDSGAEFCKFCGARYADGAAMGAAGPGMAGPGMAGGVPMQQQPMQQQPMGMAPMQPMPMQPGMQQPGMQPASSVGGAVSAYAFSAPMQSPMGGTPQQPPMQQAPMQQAPMQQPPMQAPMQQAPMQPMQQPMVQGGAQPQPGRASSVLVSIMKDGTDGRAYPLTEETTDIGRAEGGIVLTDDPYLSLRHARLVQRGHELLIRDLDSVNGVFVRIRDPLELVDGEVLLIGQQVVRFEILPEAELPLGPAMQRGVLVFGTPEVQRVARLVQYTTEGIGRDLHYLYRDETVIGREQGDIVCTDDPFMSRRHAAISIDRATRRFVLRDLGSSNGTAVRIRGEKLLKPGDQFRVGRHLFRYDRPGTGA